MEQNLQDQCQWIIQRLEELDTALSQGETVRDQSLYQRLMRERADLAPKAELADEMIRIQAQMEEARALLADGELADMAREDLERLTGQLEQSAESFARLMTPQDPDANRNVIMEIRPGAGGEEASLFGMLLLRMYRRYAESRGYRFEMMNLQETELGGIKECVFSLSGEGAFRRMKFEGGVHRVQRVPSTETGGRIHTSTCTVAVLPEAEEVDVAIDPGEVRVDVYRSTGHGGQSVNTTDSAVRVTHLPTGMVVTCQDEKSQIKNRDKAMKVLRSRLLAAARSASEEAYARGRRDQVGTGDRSERIRTYNFPQGRVTDHRLGLTIQRIDAVLDGDLDEILDGLHLQEEVRLMQAGTQSG